MITEKNTVLVLIATLALMGIVSLVVVLLIRRRIGRRIVEAEVNTDSEWSLGTVTEPGRKYNLCLKFRIEYPGGDESYGLVADYRFHAGSEVLITERAGIGDLISPDTDRRIGTQYNCDLTSVMGWNKYRATIVLCSVGPFDERFEISAAGRVVTSPKTSLKKCVIFIST
jgi:hypothetical protein